MKTTPEHIKEYVDLADYLQSENPAASEAIRALLDDLEESEAAIASKDRALTATRKQLAEAQARLQSIAEYWNRDENEEAMSDALWHIIEVAESTETSCLEAARREGEDRVIDKLLAAQANENAARSMCEDFRRQLAEAQADNAAMHSSAHSLALEAECFYLDCKDMALVSKWDDHLQTAISDVQSLQWSGDTSALSSAIAEAVEPYKRDAERWRNLKPYYTAAVFDPERKDGLNLGEGVALVFMLPKGSAVSANADKTVDALAAKEAP